MDVWTDDRGELHIDPPPTRPGDRFTIEARMPVVVGVTACSAEKSNNGHCTPIDWRVDRPLPRRAEPAPLRGRHSSTAHTGGMALRTRPRRSTTC